jgi:hypothetical protein
MRDASGNGVAGTYTAANVTLSQSPVCDLRRCALAGTTITAPVALVSNNAAWSFGSGDFTIVAAVRTTAAAGAQRNIVDQQQVGLNYPTFAIWHVDSTLWASCYSANSAGSIASGNVVTNINDGKCHLLVMTRASGIVNVYQDNVQAMTFSFPSSFWASTDNLGVGCAPVQNTTFSSAPLGGQISHVAMFKKALSDARRAQYQRAFQARR